MTFLVKSDTQQRDEYAGVAVSFSTAMKSFFAAAAGWFCIPACTPMATASHLVRNATVPY
jgi:hypothetical protein